MFPICRSITGDGLRETLRLVGRDVPLEMVETPTGTPVLDWAVPNEWNIRGAWVDGPDGTRVIDFADSNLHVLNYSVPVDAVVRSRSSATTCSRTPTIPISSPIAPRTTPSAGASA